MPGARWALPLLLLASAPAAARADAPRIDADREGRRVVTFEARPADGVDGELEAALAELLGRLHIDLVHAGNAPTGRTIARVRVEATDRGALVIVESERGPISPVRREVDRSESLALFRETLAHVILGAVEPLANENENENENENAEREPPVPSEPVAPAEPTRPRIELPREATRVSVGARIGPRLVASDRAGADFSGVAIVSLGAALRPSAELTAGYVLPARLSNRDVDAELGMVPLRLGIGIEPLASRSVSLKTTLHGGIDMVSFTPQSAPPFVKLGEATKRVQPIVGAGLGAFFPLAFNVDLVVRAGVDVDLATRHWVIASASGPDSYFETARLRPFAGVELDWAFLGTGPIPKREARR